MEKGFKGLYFRGRNKKIKKQRRSRDSSISFHFPRLKDKDKMALFFLSAFKRGEESGLTEKECEKDKDKEKERRKKKTSDGWIPEPTSLYPLLPLFSAVDFKGTS